MLPTTINNVRIFDGIKILENQNAVTIDENGLITFKASDTATIIEGSGMTLLPGLWDTHVHLSDPSPQSTEKSIPLLQDLAKHGITTAIDCGRMGKEQYSYIRTRDDLPDVRYAGNFATCTGSIHSKFQMADQSSIVDTAEQASEFVEERVEQGADFIKIVADSPVGPTQEVIDQLSRVARAHGKQTMVHAARKRAFEMALNAIPSVDIITHAPMDAPLTEQDAKQMAAAKITAVPTLVMEKALSSAGFIPGLKFDAAVESVKQLYGMGVSILVGTDSNQSFINVRHGEAFNREIDLLAEAGMQPVEILNAATQLSAKCFQLDDRGVIAEGKRADLVLVEGDPTQDIKTLRQVKKVWKRGRQIYPLLPAPAEA
jgi:imidazolonepropionase-like amidohydrolase